MVREGNGKAKEELDRDKVLVEKCGKLDEYVMMEVGKVHMPLHRCNV